MEKKKEKENNPAGVSLPKMMHKLVLNRFFKQCG